MSFESSRRSMDRAKEPGPKKPRLIPDAEFDRERLLAQRASSGSGGTVSSRFRVGEKDRREDSIRGTGAFQQHKEEQDIIAEYKAALSELTFNSKPIITNLTIIAGENMPAAKGIVATIYANILEVPTEQKLPSLYLLDSIVKNIGKDYIRYFAVRLPEVFCKAYRQVDSSIHSSMRHLFGTWKGIFQPATLQAIEKELHFVASINGSSSGTATSRLESQSQRPLHSIHVNPKYLEARQRLQQIGTQEMNDTTRSPIAIPDDKPSRMANTRTGKQWVDPSVKMPNALSQKDHPIEAAHKRYLSAGHKGEADFPSNHFQDVKSGHGKTSERVVGQEAVDKSWYGATKNSADAAELSQGNGFDPPNAYRNSRDPWSGRATTQQSSQLTESKSSKLAYESWKNSEEEEYMWEDVNSWSSSRSGSKKDYWNADVAEKPIKNLQKDKRVPLEAELLDNSKWNSFDTSRLQRPSSDGVKGSLQKVIQDDVSQAHSPEGVNFQIDEENFSELPAEGKIHGCLSSKGLRSSGRLDHPGVALVQPASHTLFRGDKSSTSLSSSSSKAGYRLRAHPLPNSVSMSSESLPLAVSVSVDSYSHKQQHAMRPVTTSALQSTWQLESPPSSTNMMDQDSPLIQPSQSGNVTSQIMGEPGGLPQVPATQDSLPLLPHTPSAGILKIPFSQPLQHSSSSPPPSLSRAQQRHQLPHSQQPHSEPLSNLSQSLLSKQPTLDLPKVIGLRGSDLFNKPGGAILTASNTSSLLTAIMKSGLVPSHTELTHSNIQPPLPCGPPPIQQGAHTISHDNVPSVSPDHHRAIRPPLPPGPPPPAVSTLPQTLNTSDAVANPFANLLSTLVAQGIISSPATEAAASSRPQVSGKPDKPTTATSTGHLSPSVSASLPSPIPVSASSQSDSAAKGGISISQSMTADREDLIGTEFKTEIIREMHPQVICGLFDDLPHQCTICGSRFKLCEKLDRHVDWHTSKQHELNRSCMKWYTRLSDWVAGEMGSSLSPHTVIVERIYSIEKQEPMVPADENQCICALCGEPFDDWYCDERDEWMYKGTTYMPAQPGESDLNDKGGHGLIVHIKCLSQGSTDTIESRIRW